jgi:hypothetical protein
MATNGAAPPPSPRRCTAHPSKWQIILLITIVVVVIVIVITILLLLLVITIIIIIIIIITILPPPTHPHPVPLFSTPSSPNGGAITLQNGLGFVTSTRGSLTGADEAGNGNVTPVGAAMAEVVRL